MTKLSDLTFKYKYKSLQDNIAKDFYVKALSHANYYDRVSAFFDSKILAHYSQWIENIYNKHWKIRFIFSEDLKEWDFELIKQWYNERAINQLNQSFWDDSNLDDIDRIHLSNLAYLISIWLVDIKIAFTKEWINHAKTWLIYDDEWNCVYFRWSSNETIAWIKKNIENFEVSCNWYNQEIENEKIESAKAEFEDLWNNNFFWAVVIDAPDVIYKKIASYNKGKLVLSYNFIPENAIVADISDNNEFVVYNNLSDNTNIEDNRRYKWHIEPDVVKIEWKKYYFWTINYKEILRISNNFEKLSETIQKTYYMTTKLLNYIEDKKYLIDKIMNLWCAIKQKDDSIINEFHKFENIVNNELKRPLREKQMRDAFFIWRMIKSANYSVPWAWKTSIVYWAYSYLSSQEINQIDNLVVVWPISSFKSWKDEFGLCFKEKRNLNDFTLRKLSTKQKADFQLNHKQYNLILVSYQWVKPMEKMLSWIIDDRTMLVFDEAHKIKAYKWEWATAAQNICKNAKYKIVLTWTPIPNWYWDLYNQLNILYTDEYKDYFWYTYHELCSNSLNLQEDINYKIYPFFCRTTKKELWVPEPNKDEIIKIDMTNKEEQLFSLIHKRFSKNILLKYIRLLQASNNPKLILNKIDEQTVEDFYEFNDKTENDVPYNYKKKLDELNDDIEFSSDEIGLISSFKMTSKFWAWINKVEEICNQINPKTNRKKTVIVRWIFVNTINKISEELTKKKISNKIIYWTIWPDEREQIIEEFKHWKFQVLITNPHTMAESVSLHMVCHDAVYFEYSFNLTHMIQSRDRINRLWLDKDQYTQYYYLELKNESGFDDAIDKKTYERLEKKEKIMLEAIEWDQIVPINYDELEEVKEILNIE